MRAHGHQVTAAVRPGSPTDALTAAARTATGQFDDTAWLVAQLTDVDGTVHCASPNDRTSAALDRSVLESVTTAFAGTSRPHVHTNGTWIHGSIRDSTGRLTEDTPFSPPSFVAWRPAVLAAVRDAAHRDIRTVAISPGNVYGHGGRIPAGLAHSPRTQDEPPALLFPGGGTQHVSNVQRDDLAEFYVLALTSAPAGSYDLAANGTSPTMAEVAAASSRGQGLHGRAAPEAPDATRDRLGPLADALLLDQQVDSAFARGLGWTPTGPSLLDELATGSYAAHPVGGSR